MTFWFHPASSFSRSCIFIEIPTIGNIGDWAGDMVTSISRHAIPSPIHLAVLVVMLTAASQQAPAAGGINPTTQPQPATAGRPAPPAGGEFVEQRLAMVRQQIAEPPDSRTPVKNPAVLEALRSVPRHAFMPAGVRAQAYADTPLPIGHGQTISQPYIVGLMTEQLELTPQSKVLEIGTGSGYQAAVLAHLTPQVYTIEIIEPLAERAAATLKEQGYTAVHCRRGDGYFGWPEEAPFDAIIVTAAAGHLPPPLWDQLKPAGRMVIPIGGPSEVQRLVVVTKTAAGERESRTVTSVRFVPLTRGETKD